ncbi:type II toxin-antitoxin system MqsA family antitoxin [Rugamonas aquatica]|uniref:YgiT-type zinc finger protein n=1 Tax=Rugamonas aquatica TaxID=2743357 RepID=A0A6A7N4Z9_9BURK|nr:type II toxin-antitoxin system MqsA family antitoxin [Rugamonas aquatica]MQA40096.1 YgiT-type zinc finger protein [Rugamonas aquatica]
MKCPVCGEAELMHGIRDVSYMYKGRSGVIAAVQGDYCPVCGESVLDVSESSRVSLAMLEFNRKIDESVDRGLMLE